MGKVQDADENTEFRSEILPRLLSFVYLWFILHLETFIRYFLLAKILNR